MSWDTKSLTKAVTDFWFGAPGSPEFDQQHAQWFAKDQGFDQKIHDQFGTAINAAGRGELAPMAKTPEGTVALLVLLDQFTRNIYRDSAGMFSNDHYAIKIADAAIQQGFDLKVSPVMRSFFYLPYEHSEDLGLQNCAVDLFNALGNAEALKWAIAHRDIIARFGRFPHRNELLNRTSTVAEVAFLKEPNSTF